MTSSSTRSPIINLLSFLKVKPIPTKICFLSNKIKLRKKGLMYKLNQICNDAKHGTPVKDIIKNSNNADTWVKS